MTVLKNVCKAIIRNVTKNQSNKRCFGTTSHLRSYEGEGKTTVNILNNEDGANIMIDGFSQTGFRLNNEMTVLGPMAIFPRSILAWDVSSINDITEESLALFTILEPKIDILVIGVGDRLNDLMFHRRLFPFSVKHKINLEILSTEQACSTFNFLNSEGRCVAGALIPPQTVESRDDDVMRSKLRYQNLYELD